MFVSMVKASGALGLVVHHYGRIMWPHNKTLYDTVKNITKDGAYKHDTGGAKVQEAADIMASTMLAPAVQGAEQIYYGYVPCRIFKSIAAGSLALSNNPQVRSVFPETSKFQPIIVE